MARPLLASAGDGCLCLCWSPQSGAGDSRAALALEPAPSVQGISQRPVDEGRHLATLLQALVSGSRWLRARPLLAVVTRPRLLHTVVTRGHGQTSAAWHFPLLSSSSRSPPGSSMAPCPPGPVGVSGTFLSDVARPPPAGRSGLARQVLQGAAGTGLRLPSHPCCSAGAG